MFSKSVHIFVIANSFILSISAYRPPGAPGLKGQPGEVGYEGYEGLKGSIGDPPYDGIPGFKGQSGEDGINGKPGEKGSQGWSGLPGMDGENGSEGLSGILGEHGVSGQPGLPGPVGPPGVCLIEKCNEKTVKSKSNKCNRGKLRKGKKGEKGESGNPGLDGLPGAKGESGVPSIPDFLVKSSILFRTTRDTFVLRSNRYLLVRHSQSTGNPICPDGMDKLWDGYSLLNIVNNDYNQPRSVDSCLPHFSAMPIKLCNSSQRCDRSEGNKSNWLSTIEPISKNKQLSVEEALLKHISRCAVCDSPATILAMHSQSHLIPDCPQNWKQLWSGYSFAMNGVQSLHAPENCLQHFTTYPNLECDDTMCQIHENINSYWLQPDVLVLQNSSITGQFINGNSVEQVGRCSVCMKN